MDDTLRTEPGRHTCLVYAGEPREQLPVIVPLLIHGLHERWRCLYLGSPEMVEMVCSALSAKGVDVSHERRRGALLLSSDRAHLDGGFRPETMLAVLHRRVDDAVRDGYQGLLATSDMMWEMGPAENCDLLLEYEALLDQGFREKPLMRVCQYRRDAVPGRAVRDALVTHPSVYVGEDLSADNLFHVPPEVVLESRSGRGDRWGEWMCRKITLISRAEREHDQAMNAQRRSEAEQRRLAEQLAATNRGLEQLVMERTADLQAAHSELESFSYSVSHDLRAPLRAIDGYARMLVEEHASMLDEEGRRRLAKVLEGAQRMGALMEDLLAFCTALRSALSPTALNMTRHVRKVLRDVLAAHPELKVTASVRDLPDAVADSSLVRQALVNLIENALKYSSKRPDPTIEIGGRLAHESTYWVKDNGVGFDMAFGAKLFGLFQRLHGQDEFEGTGVGLALVKRIVERHGGRVWAEGAVNQGATFYFTLPAPVPAFT